MNYFISSFKLLFLLLGFTAAFIKWDENKEYEFSFKSKFVLAPEALDGGQNVTATILVKKFGRDSLIVRIKDSTFVGANIHAKSRSDIEGIFGIKRNREDGSITHVISKSTTRAMEILCKKMIVDILCDQLNFFGDYAKNYETLKHSEQHRLKFAIGWCNAEMIAVADTENHLVQVLAQAEKAQCDVDEVILQAGQLLMHGTTSQIGQVKDDSIFGLSVFFDATTGKIVEVAKFTFVNLVVAGIDIQARHNMVMHYVGERPLTQETEFEKPYVSISMTKTEGQGVKN